MTGAESINYRSQLFPEKNKSSIYYVYAILIINRITPQRGRKKDKDLLSAAFFSSRNAKIIELPGMRRELFP